MTDSTDQPASVFHLGYIKTGTTTLQREVFDRAGLGCALAGGMRDSRAMLLDWFATGSPYAFDPQTVATEIAAVEAPLRDKGLVPIWSAESLLGSPTRRSYIGAEVLARMRQVPGPKKIIISIREQRAFALSGYRQMIKAGGMLPLTDYIGTGSEPRSFTPILRPDFLHYDEAVAAWQGVVGEDNLLVLPLEVLKSDPAAYFDRMARFIGIGVPTKTVAHRNKGMGGTGLVFARFMNRVQPRSPIRRGLTRYQALVWRLAHGVGGSWAGPLNTRIENRWKAQVAARYAGMFAESNGRLEAMTGLNLRDMGYQ